MHGGLVDDDWSRRRSGSSPRRSACTRQRTAPLAPGTTRNSPDRPWAERAASPSRRRPSPSSCGTATALTRPLRAAATWTPRAIAALRQAGQRLPNCRLPGVVFEGRVQIGLPHRRRFSQGLADPHHRHPEVPRFQHPDQRRGRTFQTIDDVPVDMAVALKPAPCRRRPAVRHP